MTDDEDCVPALCHLDADAVHICSRLNTVLSQDCTACGLNMGYWTELHVTLNRQLVTCVICRQGENARLLTGLQATQVRMTEEDGELHG